MQTQMTSAAADNAAFFAAVACAQRRALHSFFDQHVIQESEDRYISIDEGDYDALPMTLVDRVVHTVPGGLSDEY